MHSDLVAAYARRERELATLVNTLAANLRNLTNRVRPFVDCGLLQRSDLENPPIVMFPMVASPDVGGYVPPRGHPQISRTPRGVSQPRYGPQHGYVRHYRGDVVHLPHFFGEY